MYVLKIICRKYKQNPQGSAPWNLFHSKSQLKMKGRQWAIKSRNLQNVCLQCAAAAGDMFPVFIKRFILSDHNAECMYCRFVDL